MRTILHLTYDYVRKGKTSAVTKLIQISQEISLARVISLYRVERFNHERVDFANNGIIRIRSFGLPYGLFLLKSMQRSRNVVLNAHHNAFLDLNEIDIIHAH